MKQELEIPVYLLTGFLDGGKSRFIKNTLQEPYFNDGAKTLVILTEEGEEEFPEELLKSVNAELLTADDFEELTPSFFKEAYETHRPDRVIIEYNGMWSVPDFMAIDLPSGLICYQVITILDGSAFQLYLNNIRMTAMTLLTNTDMVIFNRCGKDTDLALYQRTVRSVNSRCDIVFEDEKGNELECPEPDLPYSIEEQEIVITDENYGTFYIDLSEHPERYIDKDITMLVQVMKNKMFPDNMFVGGRRAMTCCAADIRFLPYIFIYRDAKSVKARSFAEVTAALKWEFHEGYQEEGPVFYVKSLTLSERPKDELIYF